MSFWYILSRYLRISYSNIFIISFLKEAFPFLSKTFQYFLFFLSFPIRVKQTNEKQSQLTKKILRLTLNLWKRHIYCLHQLVNIFENSWLSTCGTLICHGNLSWHIKFSNPQRTNFKVKIWYANAEQRKKSKLEINLRWNRWI